jgi:hemin uptake protein HemP
MPSPHPRPPAIAPAPSPEGPPRRVTSAELIGHARELRIVHAGEEYRLRITSKGKLILTK